MDDSHTTSNTPDYPINQLDPQQGALQVELMMDNLVDSWEDALQDVNFNLNTDYNPERLVEAMQLAIEIDSHIKYLKQYQTTEPEQKGDQQ